MDKTRVLITLNTTLFDDADDAFSAVGIAVFLSFSYYVSPVVRDRFDPLLLLKWRSGLDVDDMIEFDQSIHAYLESQYLISPIRIQRLDDQHLLITAEVLLWESDWCSGGVALKALPADNSDVLLRVYNDGDRPEMFTISDEHDPIPNTDFIRFFQCLLTILANQSQSQLYLSPDFPTAWQTRYTKRFSGDVESIYYEQFQPKTP